MEKIFLTLNKQLLSSLSILDNLKGANKNVSRTL
jgi:hypothetical protein